MWTYFLELIMGIDARIAAGVYLLLIFFICRFLHVACYCDEEE
jgi:hypothetical protein